MSVVGHTEILGFFVSLGIQKFKDFLYFLFLRTSSNLGLGFVVCKKGLY